MTDLFKGKSFLITQNDICSINGSSVIALELAMFLMSAGASVTVYTYFLHDPLKRIFDENGIDVTDSDDLLSLNDFDYIWVHHQVLPLSVICELESIHENSTPPIFIFNHMSSLDYIADEFPYVWNLENTLSSLSVFNSVETRDKQEGMLSNELPKKLYQNPASKEFMEHNKPHSNEIEKILVVSNHPPEEIVDLKYDFEKAGIDMVLLGENQDQYRLIDLELLEQYDLVVTIGKTVQNCLVAGIPVYVYDHFGGPGYLDSDNYGLAEKNNFSGRGFGRKPSEVIYSEITENYHEAVKFIDRKRGIFKDKFTIDRLVNDLLSTLDKKTYETLDDQYVMYLKLAHNYSREHRIAARQRMIYRQELEDSQYELGLRMRDIDEIKKSKSYKLGNKIAEPLRRLKSLKEGK